MSYRSWLLIAALGLTFVADLGQAQEEAQEEQGQAQGEQPPAQPLPLPFPVEIVEDQAEAEARKRSEEEARQREIEDLIAQKGMNAATQSIDAATKDMRDYALYSTIIVGFGTLLLVWTLYLTRQANRAAQEAVNVTRTIGKAQVRAYPFIEKIDAKIDPDQVIDYNAFSKFGIFFYVIIGNSGQSPAEDASVVIGIRTYPKEVGPSGERSIAHTDRLGVIQHGGGATIIFVPTFDAATFKQIDAGQREIEITIDLSFKDVFGEKHSIRSMAYWMGGEDKNLPPSQTPHAKTFR